MEQSGIATNFFLGNKGFTLDVEDLEPDHYYFRICHIRKNNMRRLTN